MSLTTRHFSQGEIASILAAHMGGDHAGHSPRSDGGLTVYIFTGESFPPVYADRFRSNVCATMRLQGWSFARAFDWCVEADWIDAIKEQASRNSAVAVPDESACGSLCEGVPTSPLRLHVHVTPNAPPKTTAPVDDSAERHRAKRARHAERVCATHGAFDWEAIPYAEDERLGTKQRLERLEAAVMEMASHDPTGPITSARDFLSLRVSKGLSRLLGRVVYTT